MPHFFLRRIARLVAVKLAAWLDRFCVAASLEVPHQLATVAFQVSSRTFLVVGVVTGLAASVALSFHAGNTVDSLLRQQVLSMFRNCF